MSKEKSIGTKFWSFAGGHIPLNSTGPEPMFTSHDKLAILNPSDKDATVTLSIYYENDDAGGNYELVVKARRVRKFRFNDLIDPLPIPLDTPFGFTLQSNVDVVVQYSRAITMSSSLTGFCVTPYSLKNS